MSGSGKLRRRIILQRATVAPNGFNELVETWSTLQTVWAERNDVSTGERLRAQEVGAELTRHFVIRWSATVADLNARDRLIYAGVVHQITGVKEQLMNRKLEIDAVERSEIAAVETWSP